MVLQLDGRYTIVWRDPFSLQIGVDPAQVVMREVTTAGERMIAALAKGVSRSGLDMIAASSGAGEREVSALLRAVRPVLRPEADQRTRERVSIAGAGSTVDRIAEGLALAGVSVAVSSTVTDEPAELGIVVGHYVLDPDSYGFWLRRDVPHLPVVFGDESVLVGPLVEPGSTPCLFCLEHHRRDGDSSWAAIASQLWGRRARSETPLVAAEVAARVCRLVLGRLESGRPCAKPFAGRSFRIAVDSGEVTRRDWLPHQDCGCVAIPTAAMEFVSAGRTEIGWEAGSGRPRTTGAFVSRG